MRRFAYRLAFYLGRLDPDREILALLTTEQLFQWMAFLELEPPDADRADVRDAFHTAKNLNQWISNPDNKYTVRELIIEWDKEHDSVRELTGEEKEQAMAAAIVARFG